MAHKTLVGGTAYNISRGKSMVSGTAYNIKGGRTLVGGTGYNISFGRSGEPTAMLYSDGNMAFQLGNSVESGKTLMANFTGFENATYWTESEIPWNIWKSSIKNIYCLDEISFTNLARIFNGCSKLYSFNYENFNVNRATNMYRTFYGCTNFVGYPICGDKITEMQYAYYLCSNLTGSPVCGNNVTSMFGTYFGCRNLTGSPVCGNKVTTMHETYRSCYNLTGCAIAGSNVLDISHAYTSCNNIAANAYFYSPNITNASCCFFLKNSSTKRLNIYVPANSITNTTVHYTNGSSIVGLNVTWTNAGSYQYSTVCNIYIYPVANVAAAAIANGDEEANANAGITTGSNIPVHQ